MKVNQRSSDNAGSEIPIKINEVTEEIVDHGNFRHCHHSRDFRSTLRGTQWRQISFLHSVWKLWSLSTLFFCVNYFCWNKSILIFIWNTFHVVKVELTSSYHYDHWKVKVAQLCLTLCDPIYYTVHGILQARILEWVAFPFSRGSSQHRERTQVSRIAALPAEPQGKPKDTGVGSLSLLQQIFPTQESN